MSTRFDLQHQSLDCHAAPLRGAVRGLPSLAVEFQGSRVRQALGAMAGARATYYGVAVTAAVASSAPVVLVAPAVGVAVGAGWLFSRMVVREESGRQLEQRRQQARHAFAAYLDDVTFSLDRESRAAVRGAQRRLRDDFGERAKLIRHGSARTLHAARSAAAASDHVDQARLVDERLTRVRRLAANQLEDAGRHDA